MFRSKCSVACIVVAARVTVAGPGSVGRGLSIVGIAMSDPPQPKLEVVDQPKLTAVDPEKQNLITKANTNNLVNVQIDSCICPAKNCALDATIPNGDTSPGNPVVLGAPHDPIDEFTADISNFGTAQTVKNSAQIIDLLKKCSHGSFPVGNVLGHTHNKVSPCKAGSDLENLLIMRVEPIDTSNIPKDVGTNLPQGIAVDVRIIQVLSVLSIGMSAFELKHIESK